MMTARIAIFILAGSSCLSAAFAANPSVEALLALVPIMEGVSVDTPEAKHTENLIVRSIKRKEVSGWQLVNEDRVVLRRFLDTNGDKKIDRWIYFLDGQEVYRDADTDYDGIADTATRTFRLTKDEKGKLIVSTRQRSSVTTTGVPAHALEPATGPVADGASSLPAPLPPSFSD